MDLDAIYKMKIGESHQAGLQAVFNAGAAYGAEFAMAVEKIPDPMPEVPMPEVPVPDAPAPVADALSVGA